MRKQFPNRLRFAVFVGPQKSAKITQNRRVVLGCFNLRNHASALSACARDKYTVSKTTGMSLWNTGTLS